MKEHDVNERLVREWCEATTHGDLETVRRLVTTDVAFHGPRGTGTGVDVVAEWVERSGIQLELRRIGGGNGQTIADCAATWPNPDLEAATTRTMPLMTRLIFDIRDHRIAAIRRKDASAE